MTELKSVYRSKKGMRLSPIRAARQMLETLADLLCAHHRGSGNKFAKRRIGDRHKGAVSGIDAERGNTSCGHIADVEKGVRSIHNAKSGLRHRNGSRALRGEGRSRHLGENG